MGRSEDAESFRELEFSWKRDYIWSNRFNSIERRYGEHSRHERGSGERHKAVLIQRDLRLLDRFEVDDCWWSGSSPKMETRPFSGPGPAIPRVFLFHCSLSYWHTNTLYRCCIKWAQCTAFINNALASLSIWTAGASAIFLTRLNPRGSSTGQRSFFQTGFRANLMASSKPRCICYKATDYGISRRSSLTTYTAE